MSKPWQIVAMLSFVACLNYADRAALSAVFPLLRADLGMSDLALGATGTLFLWAYASGSPFAGRIADQVSRSRMVVCSLLAWSLVTLATGLVTSATQLLTMRVLLGLAECAYLPSAIALIADHHRPTSRATAMGLHLAGLNLGMVAGGAFAGFLGEQYGWRAGFYLLGSVGLVLAVVASRVLVDVEKPAQSEAIPLRQSVPGALRSLLHVPSYWIVVVQAMLIALGVWMFINWLPLYFQETFHMSLTGAGFSGTFMLQGAATLGIMMGGYASDKIAGSHLKRRMLFQAICYFVAAPFLLVFLGHPAYAAISLCIFAFSFFRSVGSSNEHAIVCDLLPTRLRSTAIGLMNTTNCIAGGIGILLAAELKQEFGLGDIFACISGIVVFAALLLLAGYRYLLMGDLAKRTHLAEEQKTIWTKHSQLPGLPTASGKTVT